MKYFISKLLVLIFLLIGTYFFFMNRLTKGFVDGYYTKFIQETDGLVLGTSRANDGISPSILEAQFKEHSLNKGNILNFAFERSQSAYGEVYLNAIQEKIKNSSRKSVFILSVTPGSFLIPKGVDKKDLIEKDKKTILGKVNNFTSKPNYNYIMNCYAHSLYNAFIEKDTNQSINVIHGDGWNEFKEASSTYTISQQDVQTWKSQTREGYQYLAKDKRDKPSDYRIKSFVKTLDFLKQKGNVFIVRIPIDADILEVEDTHWKNFNHVMDSISTANNVPYFDYTTTKNAYNTYDGSHLFSESAKRFTTELSTDIVEFLTKK